MLYNDKQEDYKYKIWLFTWNAEDDGYLIKSAKLKSIFNDIALDYVFQKEFVTRLHYQGLIRLTNRIRKKTLLNQITTRALDIPSGHFKNLSLMNIKGTFQEAIDYVTKSESRQGSPIYSPGLKPYDFSDIAILDNRDKWFLWQGALSDMLFSEQSMIKKPDDRTIIWITDLEGNSGKSKFVKYYVHKFPKEIIKLPFGSASQLRSAICTAGPKIVYFVDIPRTLGSDDDLMSIYSVIEDLKNGFITTSMYGKFQQLLFEPPHVVVFSNREAPRNLLSKDRWDTYEIKYKNLLKIKC